MRTSDEDFDALSSEVQALRAEVADLKADMERMFQALRNLQTTTLPLNVYGGGHGTRTWNATEARCSEEKEKQ